MAHRKPADSLPPGVSDSPWQVLNDSPSGPCASSGHSGPCAAGERNPASAAAELQRSLDVLYGEGLATTPTGGTSHAVPHCPTPGFAPKLVNSACCRRSVASHAATASDKKLTNIITARMPPGICCELRCFAAALHPAPACLSHICTFPATAAGFERPAPPWPEPLQAAALGSRSYSCNIRLSML